MVSVEDGLFFGRTFALEVTCTGSKITKIEFHD